MKTFEEVTATAFGIPVEQVNDNLSSKDIANWDSMNYLLFISELEKNFTISFTMDEVMNAQTLGDIHKIVISKAK